MTNTPPKELAAAVQFGTPREVREARLELYTLASQNDIRLASIQELYMARARGEHQIKFCVPALNIRGLTFQTMRAIFRAAKRQDAGAFIFELARSEMGYTKQSPEEYVAMVLAAALAEKWTGPVFVQGDHFQAKATRSGVAKVGEIEAIKKLIESSLSAGILNIDIDMSTLVDLEKLTVEDQQVPNVRFTNELQNFIREREQKCIVTSVGGELGHIGGTNSTKEECEVFLSQVPGLSKLSIQTGTQHGGVISEDGTVQKMTVDFSLHKELSGFIREKFGLAGTVQHGASTLQDEAFGMLPESEAVEVHLATGIQNMIMDHPAFPEALLENMHNYIDEKYSSELGKMSDAQFHYRMRKNAWGEFKRELWELPDPVTATLSNLVEEWMTRMFGWLEATGTRELVNKTIKHPAFEPIILSGKTEVSEGETKGLGD